MDVINTCRIVVMVLSFLQTAHAQGEFPNAFDVALLRPIRSDSECGKEGAETYCAFTADTSASIAPNCFETPCNGTCPFGASPPSLDDLLSIGQATFSGPSRPGSVLPSTEFFLNSSVFIPELEFSGIAGADGLSFACWFRQNTGNTGVLFSKATASGVERILVVTVSKTSVVVQYQTTALQTEELSITGLALPAESWHHIALTVYREDFALFLNGTLIQVATLSSMVQDSEGIVFLGQVAPGSDHFLGFMQDAYFASEALTQRDVQGLANAPASYVHLAPECRCPPSHPLASSLTDCAQYTGSVVSRGSVSRVNTDAHPVGWMNSGGFVSSWISQLNRRDAEVVIDLGTLPYEMFYIFLRLSAPEPRAFILEKSTNGGQSYSPFQYYAEDCMTYFGLENNGPITEPDGVQCVTTRPLNNANIAFRPINPSERPFTYNDSPRLRDFILATNLRLTFVDIYNSSDVTLRHLYYGVLSVTAVSRCACNGHAARCDITMTSYTCQCIHNTMGTRCDQCLPLYNSKPWRAGITTDDFACQRCECNGHASSCHYNVSLDAFPDDHLSGDGGVCDNCQDNTAGQFCETCAELYFRPPGTSLDAVDVCQPCNCHLPGVSDNGDCAKSDGIPGKVAGQCNCKANVAGLKCDLCQPGFFNLSASNPNGCEPCQCSMAGTIQGTQICNDANGQCICKGNVMGLECDQCLVGFTNLSSSNPEGCSPCGCDPVGSSDSTMCDPVMGACSCKDGVTGTACDRCEEGFFGFSAAGCQPCQCSSVGSTSNVCDATTGQCPCSSAMTGLTCSECAVGFYNVSAGCLPCECDPAGSVNGSATCDTESGQCTCKRHVTGRQCDACISSTSELDATNPDGCSPCQCFLPNTNASGDELCDPASSQCVCLEGATGLSCDSCIEGHYLTLEGCRPCQCNLDAAVDNICNTSNGRCMCSHEGIAGVTCDRCAPGYFQFPSCQECDCSLAGSVNLTCDSATGRCMCKEFVEGDRCDACIAGFSFLEAVNPSGCSAAPDEQAPPSLTLIESTTAQLTWLPPERPNGLIIYYLVHRNNTVIANVTGTTYIDRNLEAFTTYLYAIEAVNRAGSALSVALSIRTSEAPPEGIPAPQLVAINSTTVSATWLPPDEPNGVITRYELLVVPAGGQPLDPAMLAHSGPGTQLSATVVDLQPFTEYVFVLRACTSGGCNTGPERSIVTGEAPPTFQPPPNATTLSSTSIRITWSPPGIPNGVLTHFQVLLRESPFTGSGTVVFNVTATAELSVVVGELSPDTEYEFAIQSFTAAGGTSSEWVRARSGEDVPTDVQPPELTVVSSTTILINWTTPLSPNGGITSYTVFLITPETRVVVQSTVTGTFLLGELTPFTEYAFVLEACTLVGCANSSSASARTLEEVPEGQGPPTVDPLQPVGVAVNWAPPTMPNGVIQDYVVQRRTAALTSSQQDYERGVSFAGRDYARFSSLSILEASFFTTASLWFKTFDSQGTLLFGASNTSADHLAIELYDGRPVLTYDCGSGSVTIAIESDTSFNDGEWHYLTAVRMGRDGNITVDGRHSAVGSSPGEDQIIGRLSAIYVGGTAADTSTLGVNGSTFAGCVRSIIYRDMQLDFTQRDSLPESDLSISVSGCLAEAENSIHFLGGGWLVTSAVFGSPDPIDQFSLEVEFRTTDPTGVIFLAAGDTASLDVTLANQMLTLTVMQNGSMQQSTASFSVCTGEWFTLSLVMQSTVLRAVIMGPNSSNELFQPDPSVTSILLNKGTYFGGSPRAQVALGMAVRRVIFNSIVIELRNYVDSSHLVDLAWSPIGGDFPLCDAGVTAFVTGSTSFQDNSTDPFRTYLYRVGSRNSAGTAYSSWTGVRATEGDPSGVMQVTVVDSNSTSIMVTWTPPTDPNGIILRYTVTGTPLRPTWGDPAQLTTSDAVSVTEEDFSAGLEALLSALEPATVYSIVLMAETSGGSGMGPSVEGSTLEDAPEGVQPPQLLSASSTSLTLTFPLPLFPNGAITSYEVFVDGVSMSSGSSTTQNISSLTPFTNYTIVLRACTAVGCGDSGPVVFGTLPEAPQGQGNPELFVLGSRSIEARWQPPAMPNGIITEFRLILLSGPEQTTETIVFAGLDFSFVVTGLQPHTTYTFVVESHNQGGSARSGTQSGRTLEDVPEGIQPPGLLAANATALHLNWSTPETPNGFIFTYKLFILDGNLTEIFSGFQFQYVVTGLQPFTAYTFLLQACTGIGCGSSELVTYTTAEALPMGVAPLTIVSVTPSSITFEVLPVTEPNGIVTFTVNIEGLFLIGNDSVSDEVERRVVFSGSEPGMGTAEDLVPFTSYNFYLFVENSAGLVASDVVNVTTLEAPPTGLSPPLVLLNNATMVTITWTAPERPNGMITQYTVTLREGRTVLTEIVEADQELMLVVNGLVPFANYSVSITATNGAGSVTSQETPFMTGETPPEDFDAPVVVNQSSTTVDLAWDPPGFTNGILLSYTIMVNGSNRIVVQPTAESFTITELSPFTWFSITVTVCNSAGCLQSAAVVAMTEEGLAVGISPPSVQVTAAGEVLISWQPPLMANGRIIAYHVERRAVETMALVRIGSIDGDASFLTQMDMSALPFTAYAYRIVVENGAGESVGPYANFTTPQAPPEFVMAPRVTILSSTSLNISWLPPAQPNGILTGYILKRHQGTDQTLIVGDLSPDVLQYTDNDLSPFTNYSYTITACTVGGCTESLPTFGTTEEAIPTGLVTPSGIASGSASIVVAWDTPAFPNGVILRYLLYRDELGSGNTTLMTNLSSFALVYEGLDTSFEDTGLEPFSRYIYAYEVENGAGTAVSPTSDPVLTQAAPPLSGPTLFAEAVNSTSVRAEWSPPPLEDIRGPILSYELRLTPLGMPEETLVVFRGLATSFLATGLQPSTVYVVVVAVNNGAGLGFSNNVTVTTAEGIPAGVQLPNVTALSSVALQFDWTEPLYPNGQIVRYTLYLSSVSVHNVSVVGSVVIDGLRPFTNYTYQLESCTQFGCSRSQLGVVQTPEGLLQGLAAPTVLITGATSATVSWMEPSEPNGVIVEYQVYERVQVPCVGDDMCVYVECPVSQGQCGDMCYSASEQVCCAGVLYDIQSNSVCCETNYLVSNSSLPQVCCGGELHLTQSGFQCCVGRYVAVPSGSVCCETPDQMPRIGPGTACCGDTPFTQSDDVTCCGGVVTASTANSMCCGGQVVSSPSTVCCSGVAHPRFDSRVCCGEDYVEPDMSLCCPLDNGDARVFTYESAAAKTAANEQCCNGFLIPEEDSCCHGNSYNASVSICADRPTTNSTTMCGTGMSCPLSQASSAFCNRCDFNAETSMCGIHTTSPNTVSMDGTTCYEVTLVFSGLAFEYRAMNLTPFTEYGYSIVAFNSVGNLSTGIITGVTEEAAPSVVEQPAVSVLSATSLSITWAHPLTPNGVITSVNLYRNGTVIFSSLTAFSFIDSNLTAFTAYRYSLEVCTGGGCTQSPDTVAVTSADLPAGLADPIVTSLTAASVTLTWSLPDALNGLLQEFIVNETTTFGQVFRGIGLTTQLTGLMPFTAYSFILSVCNQVGCASSNTVTVRTLASLPVGVDPPDVQVLTARSLDISWTQPTLPNGIILGFILRRNGEVIYNATNLTYLDTGLTPDMQYSYTVEAYNSAGGTESGPSIVRTPQASPDGLLPPSLEVLNSTAIAVTWTAPTEPNGVISSYELLVNNIRQEVTGLVLEFLLSGLIPNTEYAVRVEACTISGCATSTETTARTLQALPSGFSAPTLRVLGPTAIEVSWQPPATPNGDIEAYEVRRMTADLAFPTLVHVGGPNVLAFNNTGLQPFTSYQYQVRVRNGAGGTLSPAAEMRTPEDIPSGVSNPFISEIAATSVLVSWQQPLAPNGLLLRFDIYLRLTLDPATLGPGVPQLVSSRPANATTALVSSLIPATSYEVMLVAVNNAGQGESDWIPFETAEAPPQNLQPIQVVDVPDTGMALVLAWDPPLLPNGVITAYAVLVDGVEVVRGLVTTHTVMQLQPFRTYSLQLEVCTSAGCSRGEIQSATTAEVPPAGQQPPALSVIAASIISVSWQPPLASNGDLLRYQVLRRLPAPLGSETSNEPMVVYSSSDLDTLAYNDSGLQPFTVYEYAVQSINSAGLAESVFVQVRTSQAAPEGFAPPVLTVLGPTSISVQWSAPNQPNGILSGYEVIRNGSTVAPTFAISHTDTLLTPFTVYEYAILACTTAGCTLSNTSTARTAEAIPTGLSDPLAAPVSSQSVLIAWSEPIFPNGIITSYMITLQPDSIQVVHIDLANLQVEISGLSPFTTFTVMLTACNTAGCSEERSTSVTTLEDVPQVILPPTLQVLGPSSVEVTWREPAVPNGQIIRYELRRNDTLIFSGAALMYIDSSLTPNTIYGYDVQAYTVAGGGTRSGVSIVLTRSDTPAGIVPPLLIPLSSSSIEATWVEPQMPNGDVTEYRLFLDGTEVFRGIAFQHTVTGLLPYTEYEFILSVCTTTCGFSMRVNNRTLEAVPVNIAPPTLQAFPNVTVFVTWTPPLSPNGVIVSYVLERRMAGGSQVTIVFRGGAVSHLDDSSELLPATEYQYRVTAANSVAGVISDFASVTTSEAPPQGVQAPEIVSVTSTSITMLIRPPLSPNGVITVYNVYSGDGVLAGEVIPTDADTQAAVFTALNLRPFTAYTFFVEACTGSGCTSGPEAQFRTAEFQPLSLAPPTAFATNGRTIFVNWTAPVEPNGNITRYTLWFRTSCPQPQQFQAAECTVGQLTLAFSGLPVGDGLSFSFSSSPSSPAHPLPYMSYEFLLQAENSVGAVNATMLSSVVTTPADAPEVVGGVLARVLDNDSILVDWSGTFQLNGLLQFYRLRRNSTPIFDGLDTSTVLLSEPKGQALIYTVTVMTSDGVTSLDATSPPVTVTIPVLPVTTAMPTMPTTQPSFNTTTPGETTTLAPGIIVAIALACIILCTCVTCGVAIVITSCILPQKEGGVRKKKKKYNRRSTEEANSFTHQRFYDHELTDFEPRPYRAKWAPGDPSQPGIWADQEPPPDLPPSVANGTSRASSKRYSYSLLEAQQQYPQHHGLAVRQSYISTAPSSSYADPKTYFYGAYEGEDDDFYEDDDPVACTFQDTHI